MPMLFSETYRLKEKTMFKQLEGVSGTILSFWRNYGGWKSFFGSPYLHLSLVLSVVIYCYNADKADFLSKWTERMTSTLPSMLGMSIAAFAIFLAVGDDEFKQLIGGSDPDGNPSPMMVAVASFTHFTLIQAIALIFAVFFSFAHFDLWLLRFLLIFLYIYALFLVIATIFAIYRIADSYDEIVKIKK